MDPKRTRSVKEMLADPRPIRGGDGTEDVDAVVESLGEISGLDDQQLADAEDALVAEIRRLAEDNPDQDAVDRLHELEGHVQAIREEAATRSEAAAAREAEVQEILSRIEDPEPEASTDEDGTDGDSTDGDSTDGDEGTTEGGDGGNADVDVTVTPPAEGEDSDGGTTAEGEGEPEAQAASGSQRRREAAEASTRRPAVGQLARRRPADRGPAQRQSTNVLALTAAADVDGFSAGREFDSMEDVARAFIARHRALKGPARIDGEQVTVARVAAEYPEERTLNAGEVERNEALIASVVSEMQRNPDALTAAGGLCAPVAVRYELENISVATRPVRDSLAQFTAARGGIRFMEPAVISDFADAVDIWDTDRDEAAAEDGDTDVKPCLRVECGNEVEVLIEAITKCLTFGNLGARAWSENVSDAIAKTMAWHARTAERQLLTAIGVNSTQVTATEGLGAARDILRHLGMAAAGIRNRHRTSVNLGLRAILPQWARDLIREDLSAEAPGSAQERLAVADAQINQFFAVRNIAVTWALEGEAGQDFITQPDGDLRDFPQTVIGYLFPEGSHLFLDGGELDLGLVRDSTLNRKNDFQMFAETFEATAFVGLESLRIVMTVCANGQTAAPVTDFNPCSGS